MGSRILDVPYKSQNDPDAQTKNNDCGPACLAMILATQGQSVRTADVYAASGVAQDRPLSFADVARAAGQYGLPLSWRIGVSLQDIRSHIDQGTPIIALIKYQYLPDRQGIGTTGGHFVLVVGYDDDAGEIVINDPYYWGPLRSKGDHLHYDYQTWEQAWGRCQEDGNPNHSLLIPQLAQPVMSVSPSFALPEPLPGVATVYALPVVDAYNGLKLRPVRDTNVAGVAVFSGRPLTVVQGPMTEGDATWLLARTQSADDMVGWACAQRGGEAYLGDAPNVTTATSISPIAPTVRTVYVRPDADKYGGLKLRPMRDVRLEGPAAHAGAALNVVADPVGSGDNEWLLVTLQDGTDTAGWVRVRQGAEEYVRESTQPDIQGAPFVGPTQPIVSGDMWVIAPAGLLLRPQPSYPIDKSMASLTFGQHLVTLGPEVGQDEKGRTWVQVRTDQGLVGWVPASADGDQLLSNTQPAEPYTVQVLDTLPVRQVGGLRLRDARNIDAPELDMARIGERLIVYVRQVEADGTPWLWVQSPRQKFGWVREKDGDTVLVSPVEGMAPTVFVEVRPFGKCLAGIGVANPQLLTPSEADALRQSRVEAVKVLTLPDPDDNKQLIRSIKNIRQDVFLVARLFFRPDAENRTRFPPQVFVNTVAAGLDAQYKAGGRYFEVHNEPNLIPEGLDWNWRNGAEFGDWFAQVLGILRQRWPEGQFGFPGLSPQVSPPPSPYCTPESDSMRFLDGAAGAIAQSDWVGVHCYWNNGGPGHWGMLSDDGGMLWRVFRDRYPDKLLMITEFSNNNSAVDYAEKGRQYASYYQALRGEANLGAAFAFALSWPGQDVNHEGWVSDGGTTAIPAVLGPALSQLT